MKLKTIMQPIFKAISKINFRTDTTTTKVFHLSREEHLSYKEIAIRLSISEKTVERHINEALKFYVRTSIYFL